MTCDRIFDADGKPIGFICSRGRRTAPCSSCGAGRSTKLCDYALKGPKAGRTCSRPLCAKCAVPGGPEIDYCPAHAKLTNGGDRG